MEAVTGVWGQSLQPPEINGGLGVKAAGGLRAKSARRFYDFSTKITHF